MSIAVDQTRLRRISSGLLHSETLDRAQALSILEIVRIASGAHVHASAGAEGDPQEHLILEAIVQRLCALSGLELSESRALPRVPDPQHHLAVLGQRLATRGARELAYALALLVSVADLELAPSEVANLEELQHALGVDDRRATDLTVFVANVVDSAA